MLMRNKNEQEVVSRERKDRRDFEQLSALATRMGLHSVPLFCSRQYAKVVVISKDPLPNYRSDLDDKRPQREVLLPFGLQNQVDAYLKAHLSRKSMNKERFPRSSSCSNLTTDGGLHEQKEPLTPRSVVAEGILRRKSLQLHNKQEDWQSPLIPYPKL
ncbi:unnamed protein product [Ilex paraguariensis]|uniref:Uncharacterized protein n=1 Tax=Ilex paraguariensis TaxID=185542 RepID=A0ABC8U3D7_9AQUA